MKAMNKITMSILNSKMMILTPLVLTQIIQGFQRAWETTN